MQYKDFSIVKTRILSCPKREMRAGLNCALPHAGSKHKPKKVRNQCLHRRTNTNLRHNADFLPVYFPVVHIHTWLVALYKLLLQLSALQGAYML